jgi:hypothetical protein
MEQLWDEMVVVEFGAEYWHMKERLSKKNQHSLHPSSQYLNSAPSEHEQKPLRWMSIARRVLDKHFVKVVKCIQPV